MWVAEVDGDRRFFFELAVFGHLRSLVPGQCFPEVGGQGGHRRADLFADRAGVGLVAEVHEHEEASGAFYERGDRRSVESPADEVAFPMPGNDPVVDLGGPLV